MYGVAHLAALAAIVVAALVLVPWARRHREDPRTGPVLTGAGLVLLLVTLAWTAWGLLPAHWDVEQSLPLQLSDVLRYVTALALLTRRRALIAICFFWGLTLNLQSVLTPDLNYVQVVWLEYLMYWLLHGAVLIVPIVFAAALGYRPSWRDTATAYGALLAWALLALGVNLLVDANYGYLVHAPAGPSLLDVMGPWPTYLVVEALVIAAVWAGMTLQFAVRGRLSPAAPPAPAGRGSRSRS